MSIEWLEFVGLAIKKERERVGMTQRELADRTGIVQSHIAKIEVNTIMVRLDTLAKIAEGLGVKASKLIIDSEVWIV